MVSLHYTIGLFQMVENVHKQKNSSLKVSFNLITFSLLFFEPYLTPFSEAGVSSWAMGYSAVDS